MKLYTEEQLRKAIDMARFGGKIKTYYSGEQIIEHYYSNEEIVEQFNSIELPTDEEIEIGALPYVQDLAFKCGAKWMRDKIKGGEQ